MIKFHDEVQIIPQQTYFKIDIEEISAMFEPDSIIDRLSTQKLRAFGGIQGFAKLVRTNLKMGIGENDKELREDHFGLNDPTMAPSKTLLAMVLECFDDLMLQILCVATVISTVIGIAQDGLKTGWMEGFTIFLAVIIIVSVSAGNDYVKEKQFEKLNAKKEEMKHHVIREGNVVYLDSKELLVGDLLTIQIGDILQIDGILLEGSELQMDESAITGESEMINKIPIIENEDKPTNLTPFLISGSKVMEGSGKLLVCTVGAETQIGKLKEKLIEEQPPTPLQQKLEGVAEDIGKIGTVAALLTMLALVVHLGVNIYLGQHCFLCVQSLSVIVNAFLIAVTIVVVAVPEGLPLAVTIALAFSVGKMKDENNLVKQLSSCEIMGGATNICSDKTGTLTQNLMSVSHLYIDGQDFSIENLRKELFSKSVLTLFNESVCINSSAYPKQDPMTGKWDQVGNKTECALIEIAHQFGCNYQQLRPSDKIIRVLPFSSSRKKMTTIYQMAPSFLRVYVKGATEVILERCNRIIANKGYIACDYLKKTQIKEHIIKKYAGQALRTLGIAYKDIPYTAQYSTLNENFLESDLTLVAIAGIKDPLRPEIAESIKQCKGAGIRVRMITGDNIHTAVAIAKDCGILAPSSENKQLGQYEVLEGKVFRELVGGLTYDNPYALTAEEKGQPRVGDFEMFKTIAKELRVMARSTPDDKYILVTGLLQMQEVVAVTGDGTNDAPALKKADVGFAMGISGTEVAKEAAGIILLDDNFASIVTACKWGRNVYESVRKFIQFQLTVNISALFMSFMSSVVLQQSPLNSIEMLWVNIIMDTFASLALATEPPHDRLLDKGPQRRNQSIISANMWRNVFGQSIYQIVLLSLILFKGPEFFEIPSSIGMTTYDPQKAIHFTIFFQAFVLMQVFNEFNSRKLERSEINIFKGLFNNMLFWFIIIVTFVVQYGLVEFGGQFVGVTKLTMEQHLYCILIGAGSIIMGVFIKIFPNFIFNQISIFKEDPMDIRNMDRSWTSMMRRRSSLRMGYDSQNSNVKNSKSNSQAKK